VHTENAVIKSLENAMDPIIAEMFQNGPEEGCRIWEDEAHPLHQAVRILLQAKAAILSEAPEYRALIIEVLKRGEPDGSLPPFGLSR
jgi:hypothetical protein